MPKQKQDGQLGETRELPPGVKLVRSAGSVGEFAGRRERVPLRRHDPAVADLCESLREWEMR